MDTPIAPDKMHSDGENTVSVVEQEALFKQVQPTLEQAHYQVDSSEAGWIVQQDTTCPLQLKLKLHTEDHNPDLQLVHVVVPLSIEIPDQYWLSAAQVIAEINRESPLGEFSICEESRPYFDYRFWINTQGEFSLKLLEAIQMSFVLADRFFATLQETLTGWLQGYGRGAVPQSA